MKQQLKTLLSLVVAFSLVFSSTSAFASSPESSSTLSWKESTDVIANGENIGTLTTTYFYDKKVENNEETTVFLNINKHYNLTSSATEIQKQEFADKTNSYEITVTDENDYYVNGKKLTESELSAPIEASLATSNIVSLRVSQDRGGVPAVSHYYGDFTNYHLASYSDLNIMGGPQGSNYQADGKITNVYVQRAMSSIDSFASDHSSLNTNRELFLQATGAAVATLETVIVAIVAGVGAAGLAVATYNAFQDCKGDLSKTVSYMQLI